MTLMRMKGGGAGGDVIICFVCVWCGEIFNDFNDSVVYNCFHHGQDMESFFVCDYSLVLEQVFDFVHKGEDE